MVRSDDLLRGDDVNVLYDVFDFKGLYYMIRNRCYKFIYIGYIYMCTLNSTLLKSVYIYMWYL